MTTGYNEGSDQVLYWGPVLIVLRGSSETKHSTDAARADALTILIFSRVNTNVVIHSASTHYAAD